jgi:anti-anti-sigma factor
MSSVQVSSRTPNGPEDASRPLVAGDEIVLSPQEPLIEGGSAEEFERRVQALFKDGHRRLVVDLGGVAQLDSAGIRALVRGHTTAQRLGGSFKLVGPNAHVRTLLQVTHLDSVFAIYDSLDAAQARQWPWKMIAAVAGGAALCVALVWSGLTWPAPAPATEGAPLQDTGGAHALNPFVEVLKLIAAALIGLLVTAVHRPAARDKPLSRSIEHAQVLLCVSGAMIMIIIGNSVARAFGIAGAASIIRFRTPVEDPKDVTIIFLLMALGMATGLGSFAVAGLGTGFLCVFLLLLEGTHRRRPRSMMAELAAEGRDFPLAHVHKVFARHHVVFEPREISQGKEATITYLATLLPDTSLEDLSADLMGGGSAGLKSVSWEPAKKSATS